MLVLVAVVGIAVSHLVVAAAAQPHFTGRAPAVANRWVEAQAPCAGDAPRITTAWVVTQPDYTGRSPAHASRQAAAPPRPAGRPPQHPNPRVVKQPRFTGNVARHDIPWYIPDPEGQRNAQLGCALCLAVADWLNTSLVVAHEGMNRTTMRLTPAEVSSVLATACDCGFEGYQLWPPPLKEDPNNEMAGVREKVRLYSRETPPSNWKQRLRNECRWYLQEADEQEVYRQWRGMLDFPALRLDLFLCKNSGWLRVCANLPEDQLPTLSPPVVEQQPAAVIAARQATRMATYSLTRFRIIFRRMLCWEF